MPLRVHPVLINGRSSALALGPAGRIRRRADGLFQGSRGGGRRARDDGELFRRSLRIQERRARDVGAGAQRGGPGLVRRPPKQFFGYNADSPTKSALRSLAEALRPERQGAGIHVMIICPLDTDTPQLAEVNRLLAPGFSWSVDQTARRARAEANRAKSGKA